MPRKRHSMRYPCPICGNTGKIRGKSYVTFVCKCGLVETAPTMDALKTRLKELRRNHNVG